MLRLWVRSTHGRAPSFLPRGKCYTQCRVIEYGAPMQMWIFHSDVGARASSLGHLIGAPI